MFESRTRLSNLAGTHCMQEVRTQAVQTLWTCSYANTSTCVATVHFNWLNVAYFMEAMGKSWSCTVSRGFFPGGSAVKNPPASPGDLGLILGSGRSPGERNGDPLQCSYLENSMDRGAWWVTRVAHDLTTKQQQPHTVSSTFPSVGNFEMHVPEWTLWALFFFFFCLGIYF